MIDTKLYEEMCCKRAELKASHEVCNAIFDFAKTNAQRCTSERSFIEADTWINVMTDINVKLQEISVEYDRLIKILKEEA